MADDPSAPAEQTDADNYVREYHERNTRAYLGFQKKTNAPGVESLDGDELARLKAEAAQNAGSGPDEGDSDEE